MTRIAIVADSSACLPPELLHRHGIFIVPLTFILDGRLCRDGELTGHEFYERLRHSRGRPSTNAPAPGEFLEAFRRARDGGAEAVLCLTLPPEFSGTHSSARNAVAMAEQELPGVAVQLADTGGLAMVHGFAVLAAAKAAEAGATIDKAVAAAHDVSRRAHLVGALDTMRFLARGGRVPWIVHWAASLLQIKPILSASGGKIGGAGRARTMARAMDRILRYAECRASEGRHLHAAVMHADAPERARDLATRVQERLHPAEMLITEFTSVMGIHTGPGFVGLAFYSGGDPP